MTNRTPYTRIIVSGGFDPIHVGHVRMIKAAANLGNVIVVANSDAWLMRKKGYIFMPWEERAEIIRSIEGVYDVVEVDDSDGTVCEVLQRLKPDMFGNGGDRTNKNTPEMEVCDHLNIKMIWGLGGGKIQSSSDLVKDAGLTPPSGIVEDLKPSKSIILRGKSSET
jgi:cytidyltransferase-like protein